MNKSTLQIDNEVFEGNCEITQIDDDEAWYGKFVCRWNEARSTQSGLLRIGDLLQTVKIYKCMVTGDTATYKFVII